MAHHGRTPESVLNAPARTVLRLLGWAEQTDLRPRAQRRALARAATANPKRAARLLRRAGLPPAL
jgi:hypothetical protein